MGKWYDRWDLILLAVLLVALFWLRMELATSVSSLSYDSYLQVRKVDHILDTGWPLREDPLSITTAERVGSPVFSYLLAAAVLLSPIMYKLLPNLFMVLLLLPVFFITRHLTRSTAAAFLGVVLAGTGPFVFGQYLNTPSASPLAAFLFFLVLALLHDPDRYLQWIVGLTILLTFLHPLAFILVLSILATIVLLRLEGFGVDQRLNELFIFTAFLGVWFHILIYKKALFAGGVRLIWQNMPDSYVQATFGNITFLTVLYGLGALTFLFGVLGIYHALFEQRVKGSFAVIGASIVVALALLLRLMELELGLLLLTVLLAIMAAHGLLVSLHYLRRTRAPWLIYPFALIAVVLFFSTAILPSLSRASVELQEIPPGEDIAAFRALRTMLPDDAVLLTTVREAAAVQFFSGHTTLTDSDFLLVEKSDELISDIDAVYTARFTTTVLSRADKLGFTHILFTHDAARQYGRESLLVGNSCIVPDMISEEVYLYRIVCEGSDG